MLVVKVVRVVMVVYGCVYNNTLVVTDVLVLKVSWLYMVVCMPMH